MKFVPKAVTRTIGRQILLTKKNSPHIFFAAGVIGAVGSTVLACRATLKLDEVLAKTQRDIERVRSEGEAAVANENLSYSENDFLKDKTVVLVKSVASFGRLYAPAIAVGGVSIACLTGSHVQLTRRNTALTATLALISKAYDDYRIRVQDEIGVEKELEIHRGIHDETHTIDGKKQTVKVFDPNGLSIYARIFDEVTPCWKKEAELNHIFLQCQQNYLNQILQARGHVFLNEVYDMLGFDRTPAGQIVGWVLNGDGDGFVDFGLFDTSNTRNNSHFLNGNEPRIVLDFNVDGPVFDKI